jgi:hypothetical protein
MRERFTLSVLANTQLTTGCVKTPHMSVVPNGPC